jgi:drug/metabolite transporter (DMT)-like permease
VAVKLRIRSGRAKVGYIVASIVLILLVGTALFFAVSREAAQVAALVVGAALLIVGVRAFRGPSEQVAAPRAWWRMTERPVAGFLLAIFFALAGIGYLVAPFNVPAMEVLYLGVYALVVVAYVHSSIRLTLWPTEEFQDDSPEP